MLMKQIAHYPPDTIFHFRSWTLGYEEVWVRIASELGERVSAISSELTVDTC